MTSYLRLTALKAITLSAALSMTAGLALAGDNTVSSDQIVNALKPKPLTRNLSIGPQADPAVQAKEAGFVQTLRFNKGSSAAAGIVFGLLCSAIAWMFLAYGIYRLHAMSIAVR